MDEGKLWSLIRNVLSQGGAIQLDRASMSGYEEYSARLDAAASERVADFAKLADARIAELERECEQWRDELRIYRETENKRIAELDRLLAEASDVVVDAHRYLAIDPRGREFEFERLSSLLARIKEARAGNGGEG